jgi:L-lactate permease
MMMMMIKTASPVASILVVLSLLLLSWNSQTVVTAFQQNVAGRSFLSLPSSLSSSSALFAYVPDGFTPESYKAFKAKEAAKKKKDLGRLGPKGFQCMFVHKHNDLGCIFNLKYI